MCARYRGNAEPNRILTHAVIRRDFGESMLHVTTVTIYKVQSSVDHWFRCDISPKNEPLR